VVPSRNWIRYQLRFKAESPPAPRPRSKARLSVPTVPISKFWRISAPEKSEVLVNKSQDWSGLTLDARGTLMPTSAAATVETPLWTLTLLSN
jgi:hypothetical protein